MYRFGGCLVVSILALGLSVPAEGGEKLEPVANRPHVPGKLRLHLRERQEDKGNGGVKVVEKSVDWDVMELAWKQPAARRPKALT